MATKNIVPRGNLEGGLGTSTKRWNNAYVGNLDVSVNTNLKFTNGSITDVATQAQAEAGSDNTTAMTPLRTKNAIDDRNFATNGALSMPSSNGIYLSQPTFTPNNGSIEYNAFIYTAPCDGWLCIEATVNNANEHLIAVNIFSTLGVWNSWSAWQTARMMVPMSKGTECNIHLQNINTITIVFEYAQSEV